MTPDQEVARKERLLAAARATLSMQTGLTVGAFRLVRALSHLGQIYEARHRIFREFTSEIPPEVPVGTARLHWAPHLLIETDAVLAAVEARYRRRLLEECSRIINLYGPNNSFKPTPLRGSA